MERLWTCTVCLFGFPMQYFKQDNLYKTQTLHYKAPQWIFSSVHAVFSPSKQFQPTKGVAISNCGRLQPKPAPCVKCWLGERYLGFSWRGSRHRVYIQTRGECFWGGSEPPFTKEWHWRKQHSPPSLPPPWQTRLCQHTSFPSVLHQPHYVGEWYQKREKQISGSCQRKHHDCWVHGLAGSDPCLKDSEMGTLLNCWCPFSKPRNSQSLASSYSVGIRAPSVPSQTIPPTIPTHAQLCVK